MWKQLLANVLFWAFYVIVPAIIVINAIRVFIKARPKQT